MKNEILQKRMSNTGLGAKLKWLFSDWQLYILLLPALIYVFIFRYIPIYGVQIAFKDFRADLGIWGSRWVNLQHFKRFITFPNFWFILWNTASLGLYSLATFPCSIIFALGLNEITNLKFKKIIQMISYAPHFLSVVVVCSMVRLFLARETGVLNHIISFLGHERMEFMTIASAFRHIYIWSGVWQGIGWGAIIYLAALSGVPVENIEAAKIDGASRFQIVRYINIPHIMPTIMILLILRCGDILTVGFEKILLLQTPLNLSKSQVISTYVYELGLKSAQFSYASSIGLFDTTINVLILLLVNSIAKKMTSISIW